MSQKRITLLAITCLTVAFVALMVLFAPAWAQTQELSQNTDGGETYDAQLSDEQDATLSASKAYVYRLYNPYTGEHLYSLSDDEKNSLVKAGWKDEGIGWVAPVSSKYPVYRLNNPYSADGDHHYTRDTKERDKLVKGGWQDEGIGWYSLSENDEGALPLLRQYNPYGSSGTHNYTLSQDEEDALVKAGWRAEGVAWYGYAKETKVDEAEEIDFSKAKVDTADKEYKAAQWTPSVSITGLTKDKDYTVTYGTNKAVGKGTITIKGKGDYTGSKTYQFNIKQKTITSVKWSSTSFNYNGKEQAPSASPVGLCGSDKASVTVVVAGTHKNAGTYVANAASISNSNYKLASNIKVTYKINKINPTYTVPGPFKAGVVQVLGDITLPTATNGKFTWQDKSTTTVGNAGSNKFKVTFTPTDTTNYNTVKDIAVTIQVFEVAGHTVTFDNQYQGKKPTSAVSDDYGIIEEPTDAGASLGLKIEGWYTDSKCTNDEEHKWDFAKDVVLEDMTLYANWVPADGEDGDLNDYWLSPSMQIATSSDSSSANSNYVKAAWNVRKSTTQIQSDVNVLIKGDIEGNDSYADVKAEYEEIMKSDNYHLYTVYKGSDAKTEEDKFAEFRILEVGQHKSDGSALTFQATHALPTATQMYETNTNVGGWVESKLYSELQEEGSIFANFNTGLTDDIIYLEKFSTVGGGQDTDIVTDTSASSNKFWIASRSEMTGSTVDGYSSEGSQYAYYSNLGVSDTSSNKALAKTTRSGAKPATASDVEATWWERSPCVFNSEHFITVDLNGYPNFNAFANRSLGVVPAFSFGVQKIPVRFDIQGHGNEVGSQYVEDDELLTDPTEIAGTSEGLVLEGWYKNDPDCKTENKFNFDTDYISERTTLYANWIPAEEGDALKYWISPSKSQIKVNEDTGYAESDTNEGYVKAAWNVKKSSAEIESDVKVLLRGDVVGNSTYAKVKAEYEEFMNNDSYHLYTAWDGAASDADDEDKFVEFRILNVGEHDKDESALTFQATHMLTTSAQMNTSNSNVDGWAASQLRTDLQSGGSLFKKFKTGFTSAIFPTSKVSTVGGGTSSKASTETSTSSNVFWITSRSELSGTSVDGFKDEGSQYTFYADKNIKDVAFNDCLIMKTRSGANPDGSSNANCWWERSPNTEQSAGFMYVDSRGYPGTDPSASYKATYSLGVVPSFCFGRSATHTVSFSEADGTAVAGLDPITVGDSQTFAKPADPAKDQYEFDGWYSDPSFRDEFTFDENGQSKSVITADTTLYAKWSTLAGAGYWLSTAGLTYSSEDDYASKDAENYKSATDIKNDVLSIKNPLAEDHDAVIEEYTNYMTNDNVHLYTKWSGGTTDSSGTAQAANGYVEFRIIQVGEHDGDGSGLTLQAVHALPTASVMNQNPTNASGWAQTALRNTLARIKQGSSTSLYDYFAAGLKKDVKKVSKASNNGAADKENYTTTSDGFFLLSYNEVTGTSQNHTPKEEGTQYAFFVAKEVKPTADNDVLKMKTRAGNVAKNASTSTWWLRSPNISNASNFVNVGVNGAPHYSVTADTLNGVVPAFCF